MRAKIESMFININGWLQYLESKNGLIVGFDSAVIFAIYSLLENGVEISPSWDWIIEIYLIQCGIFIFSSLIVSLASLVPKKGTTTNINIHYFSDVAKINAENLKRELLMDEDIFERHMLEQIITNAKIADKKQKYASLSLFLILSAFTTIIGACIIQYYKK